MQSFVGDLVAAVGPDPGAWSRDPVGQFRSTGLSFMAAIDKFEKRRRALRVLEAQNVAVGRLAVSLPVGQARQYLSDAYTDNLAHLEALRSKADWIAAQVSKGLEALQQLRSLVQKVPGGQFVAGLGFDPGTIAVMVALGVVVVGATATILGWVVYNDHVVSLHAKELDFYAHLNIPDQQKADGYKGAKSAGGNPDPGATWKAIGEKTASGVMLLVAGALFLPLILKSVQKR